MKRSRLSRLRSYADASKINLLGVAIALGHPLGAGGAVSTATIVYRMKRRKQEYGMGAEGIFESLRSFASHEKRADCRPFFYSSAFSFSFRFMNAFPKNEFMFELSAVIAGRLHYTLIHLPQWIKK